MSVQSNTLSPVSFRGERLRTLRRQQRLSADKLAHATGLTARHIFRLERNERPQVWAVTVAQLALALGTSTDYFLGLTNDPVPHSQSNSVAHQVALPCSRQEA